MSKKFKFVRYRMLVTVHEIDADSQDEAYYKYETELLPRAIEMEWVDKPSHYPEIDVTFEVPENVEAYHWSYPYDVTSPEELLDKQIDITGPEIVEISIKEDGKVLWINVDGICVCRVCRIKEIVLDDRRKSKLFQDSKLLFLGDK